MQHQRRWACAALLAGMLALCFLAYRKLMPRNLLELARPAFVVPEWRGHMLQGFVHYHWWISQDECLVAIPDKGRGLLNLVRYRRSGDTWQRSPVLLDGLPDTFIDAFMIGPSPDGKWFAWSENDKLNVALLGGVQRISYDCKEISRSPYWSVDSRHLILYPQTLPGTALKYGLDPSVEPEKIAISLPPKRGWKTAQILMVTSDSQILACKDTQNNQNWDCVKFGVGPTTLPPQYYSIPVPNVGVAPESFAIPFPSPRGDSICWGTIHDEAPLWQQWTHKVFPNTPEWTDIVEIGLLWHPGEPAAHEIGRYNVGRAKKGQSIDEKTPWINDPQWMPDGRHMSFLWRDSVFTILVE